MLVVSRWEDVSAPALAVGTPELWLKVVSASESVVGPPGVRATWPTVVSGESKESPACVLCSEP